MRIKIDKLFLYRHRFVIGYTLLTVVFFFLLVWLPMISPDGISTEEMESTVESANVSVRSVTDGDVVNMPYRLLQKASISVFGLSLYSIKIPSIIIAAVTAVLLVLLLNRWFKSNVAIIASVITTLSSAFLFLAGFGTPAIMYLFWMTLILWLGSKILGESRPHPVLVSCFVAALAFSLYTPHLIYIALIVAIAGILHPHMRFTIKKFKLHQIIVCVALFALVMSPLVMSLFTNPDILKILLFNVQGFNYADNVISAFQPFFSFGSAYESVFSSPLFGLATVALLFVGVLASFGKLFTSRNTVVSLLVIFAIAIAGIGPYAATIIIIPISVLVAAGLESILEKWYSLFPENPYARVFGLLPIAAFTGVIVVSSLSHFVFGYHYTPMVANQFNDDITLIKENLSPGTVLLVPENTVEYRFYKNLEGQDGITVMGALPKRDDLEIATLGKWEGEIDLPLYRIITSQKSQDSDRLYLYNN
ncbi:MAG: glycosyltransferase family 39 protein [Candidatus Nomurabacteria bacterium]|jgi:4-amino-4-deoxy-L-arabinose transferase-like glycosyltransferase|nr:glycosyltransferase family 39 protein [Candidatus Nomurabacteria bacterium]